MKYSLSVVFVTYDLFGNIVFHCDELPEASFCISVYQHLEVVHWYEIARCGLEKGLLQYLGPILLFEACITMDHDL